MRDEVTREELELRGLGNREWERKRDFPSIIREDATTSAEDVRGRNCPAESPGGLGPSRWRICD